MNKKESSDKLDDQLREGIDRSSSINRNLGLLFAGFLIYIAITIGGTTDLMLLLPNSRIPLPLLQIELPLIGFYLVTPLLVMTMHANLLINLLGHSRKINVWLSRHGDNGGLGSVFLHPFIFNYYRTAKRADPSLLVAVLLVEVVAYYLPMAALLFFLARFSDYQSAGMTTWHFSVLVFDALLVLYFKAAISDRDNHLPAFKMPWAAIYNSLPLWMVTAPFKILGRWCTLHKRWPVKSYFKRSESRKGRHARLLLGIMPYCGILIIGILYLRITLIVCSDEGWQRVEWLRVPTYYHNTTAISADSLQSTAEGSAWRIPVVWVSPLPEFLFPRITVSDEVLTSSAPDPVIIAQYLAMGRTEEDAWLDFSKGIDLSGRSLRYASLIQCKLYKAKLDRALFDRADLREAQLQGAYLSKAQMQKANLSKTKMQGADFWGVRMQDAYLSEARMQGTDLGYAYLQRVNLREAQLQKANFEGVQMQGANFGRAQMQGVNFWWAQMQGANFSEAQLQGANFQHAKVQGAGFRMAQMQGANLREAQLQGADLLGTQLQGASLLRTQLQGANLQGAQMQGCLFRETAIRAADFTDVEFENCLVIDLDTVSVADWDTITTMMRSLAPKIYRPDWEFEISRIDAAKSRGHSSVNLPISDKQGFIAYRKQMVCDSTYPLLHLLLDLVSDTSGKVRGEAFRVNCPLLEEVDSSCPERWAKIMVKKRETKLWWYVYKNCELPNLLGQDGKK